ncbi:MAG TPA: AlpA family phage regulatory protein [Stellaceae bacterium]|jgi:prophage regulatory protein|nr:AlpA family phage regulatory protein [Stellaceae bacterium]
MMCNATHRSGKTLARLRKSKPAPGRLIRRPEVLDLTGYSYTTIWREEKAGRFPKRVQLSPMAVGWFENEVLDWIQSRVREGGKRPPVQWRGGAKNALQPDRS